MKIVIGGVFPPGAVDLFLQEFPKDLDIDVELDAEKLYKRTDVEVLVTRGFEVTADFIAQNQNLKFIQKWGSGLNTIDVKAAGEHGIPVSNVPGANSYAVAELTVMLMLAVYRNLLYHHKRMSEGVFSKTEKVEDTYCLCGKTIGIIGGGHIGKLVAHEVQSFGAKTIYYDAFRLSEEDEKNNLMEFVTLEELLRNSDIVSLHIPLIDSTKNFIGKEQIAMMKDNAVLINAARGGLVDETALLEALDSGKLLGAGIDCPVHEKDKFSKDDPLFNNEKVTMLPHVGGTSNDLIYQMVPRMAKNAIRYVKGEPILSVANNEFLK